jgi:hypothetical protein
MTVELVWRKWCKIAPVPHVARALLSHHAARAQNGHVTGRLQSGCRLGSITNLIEVLATPEKAKKHPFKFHSRPHLPRPPQTPAASF